MSYHDNIKLNYSKSISPTSQLKKLGLRATKDLYWPIDFSNMPINRHSLLLQSFRAMLHQSDAFYIIKVGASTIQNLKMHNTQCIWLMQHHSEALQKTTMPGNILVYVQSNLEFITNLEIVELIVYAFISKCLKFCLKFFMAFQYIEI